MAVRPSRTFKTLALGKHPVLHIKIGSFNVEKGALRACFICLVSGEVVGKIVNSNINENMKGLRMS